MNTRLFDKGHHLYVVFNKQPIIFFGIIFFVMHPSLNAFLSVLIATVACAFLLGTSYLFNLIKIRKFLIKDYIDQFNKRNWKFIQESVLNYLDEKSKQAFLELNHISILSKSYIPYSKHIYNPIHDVRIYIIERENKKESFVIPNKITAHSIPFFCTYIFVRDKPDLITLPTKYMILHEIGHGLNTSMINRSLLEGSNTALLFCIFWCTFFVELNIYSSLIIFLMYLTSYRLYKHNAKLESSIRFEEEILADNFAIEGLKRSEQIKLLDLCQKLKMRFPFDDDQLGSKNYMRQSLFIENLRHAINDEKLFTNHGYSKRYTRQNSLNVYLVTFFVSLAGWFSIPPTNDILLYQLVILLFSIALYIIAGAIGISLSDKINQVLPRNINEENSII